MKELSENIRNSLTAYSIFGYLLPGFFITTLLIFDYDGSKIIRLFQVEGEITMDLLKSQDLKTEYILHFFSSGTISDFKFIPFAIFLLFCYLLGHIISAFSSFGIERLLVRHAWGFPSAILMTKNYKPKCQFFLGNYRKALNIETQTRLSTIINETFGFHVNKDDYYWLCYSYIITARPYLAPRVHHFVNLYGFSRNVAATFILYIIVRIVVLSCMISSNIDHVTGWLLMFYCFIGFIMFWNYLKLYKRQAIDIYYLFMAINVENEAAKNKKEPASAATGM
jgi:hypothetical protein